VIPQLNQRVQEAVQAFWDDRKRQQAKQIKAGRIDAGTRGAVTGGTQMGALELVVHDILVAAGLDRVHVKTRTGLELPGYYRPEKKWDLLAVTDDRLVMAIEFKSQVGPSFGNNFNNRTEEAIGNAEDIWTAYREGRFGHHPPPFLGYLFLLEDCPKVHAPVTPALKNSSYAQRYEVLCDRLLLERKYNAACLILATNADPTRATSPSHALSFSTFAAAVHAHARFFVAQSST
jgi:hypothetical protein